MTQPARILKGEPEFMGWLGQARPGDAVVYHRGFLAVDRRRIPNRDLNRLANRASWAATCGLVDLLQRRHGFEDLSYLAIARRRPNDFANLTRDGDIP